MFFITIVLLFLIRIRFPKNKPIVDIIRNRYGGPTVKCFREVETTWRKRDKVKCDVEYLQACYGYNTIPKFLRIKLYRRTLESTGDCITWQRKLLHNEITYKQKSLHRLDTKLSGQLSALKSLVGVIDFSALKLWLTNKQNNVKNKTKVIHEKKLNRLGIQSLTSGLDATSVIYNFSNRVLSNDEKRLLLLGLDFKLPIVKLNFVKYYLLWEKLCYSFNSLPIYDCIPNARDMFNSVLKSMAHKYFYNFNSKSNLCPVFAKSDFKILKNIASDPTIHITKPDKGCGVVIMNKENYVSKVYDIINDQTKFNKSHVEEKKLITKLEDKLNNALRTLRTKRCISEEFYRECYASGSQLGYMYGLPKVHKSDCPVRPIVAAYGTYNFNLGKLILPMISQLAINQYTVKNSYDFTESINQVNNADKVFMCSLDITSLYTNIPVNETIEIILNRLFINETILYKNFTRSDFKKLLTVALNDTYFKFNGEIFKQTEGLAMGGSCSPIIANIFLNEFETNVIDNCPLDFKPQLYKSYLDDTFLLFDSEVKARNFFNYINSIHANIQFTFEGEQQNRLPFLDVTVQRSGNVLTTSVFRKKTFTGLGLNYFSNIYDKYKIAAIFTLINRGFKLSSSYNSFHEEMLLLKSYFKNNLFPSRLFDTILKRFLESKFNCNRTFLTAPRQILYLELPFIGHATTQLRKELLLLINRFSPHTDPKLYFRNNFSIGSIF